MAGDDRTYPAKAVTTSEQTRSGSKANKMSSWAYFRKTWLKPEVYPLIGAMGAALGICGLSIYNKTRDTIITWDKSKRGNMDYLGTVDEFVPFGNSIKSGSARIFGSENVAYESQSWAHAEKPQTFTVRIGDAEEEEEAEAQVEEVAETASGSDPVVRAETVEASTASDVDSVAVPVAPVEPVVALKDESIDKIQAALDAALDLAEKEESTKSSVGLGAKPSASV